MIRFSLPGGEVLPLRQSPHRTYKGPRIPGSTFFQYERAGHAICLHVFKHRLYTLTLRKLHFATPCRLLITEANHWLRMELPLSGALPILQKTGTSLTLLPGNYHLTDAPSFASDYATNASTLYFTAHFAPELLAGLGADQPFSSQLHGPVPLDLLEMVYDIMKCPFQEAFRNFYYANKVRELLFSHSVSVPAPLPGELSPGQIAQMYEADRIMAGNLDGRITIPALARQLGTNFVTLKRNYEKVFGIGIFPKLMQRKMECIQLLLEKTDKPLKEIADLAGYQTLPGFINAFRKRFKVTPKEWRMERRGLKGRA